MPKFVLMLRSDVTADHSDLTPDDYQRILGAYNAWYEQLASQGLVHIGQKLTDEGGRVMVPGGDGVTVKDGPYVESKEVLGGFYIISADSYDHAVALCEGHPNFEFGSIEVRQIDFMGGPEDLQIAAG